MLLFIVSLVVQLIQWPLFVSLNNVFSFFFLEEYCAIVKQVLRTQWVSIDVLLLHQLSLFTCKPREERWRLVLFAQPFSADGLNSSL